MVSVESKTFKYVQEGSEDFLALFPHRYDFIYAAHPNPKAKPEWQTETRYPLSDRQLLKGEYLYGVRFESETQYFLLDIDHTSPYHPQNTPLVLERLFSALEPIGLTDHITCTSSDSQGLHLYFPISKTFNSWKLSKAVSIALENAGFKLKLGQLELFPNPKAYSPDETPSLFSAHRLPLQMGSYILNDELQPINSSQTHFVRMWQLCQQRNVLNTHRLRGLLKQAKQISYQLSNKASKFLDDLNTEIEAGWTDYGQTNRLLGRITMRTFIFNHITEGGEPLEGKPLVEKIVSVAKALPGYKDWCRHQDEIEVRAIEWARCIENSHYFAYGTAKGKYKELSSANQIDNELDYNQQRAQETQAKITAAIEDLRTKNALPETATARFKALLGYRIGGASLYRYRELWHPIELETTREESGLHKAEFWDACTESANVPKLLTSLLPQIDSNPPIDKPLSDQDVPEKLAEGNNSLDPAQVVRDRIKQQLADTQKAQKLAHGNLLPVVDPAGIAIHRRALQRMQEFLLSGEPVLLAEVGQWLANQSQTVRNELIDAEDDVTKGLLCDLAEIALRLVQQQLSPWEVRFQLEERFGKFLILELTHEERQAWVQSFQ
ncbi:hypothetical protein [Leptothoe sp. PORK10 BA2]|uniref:hypothetical protein n=1 Tax=Leptothoe sp. PORK10 BA2 TaxID=3110254 RepID=UPI002B2008B8|nr:hypothetical protein [Leptothoe sp. PORK10 BA2]MEA5466846.1 hypothetical protein [Leptothoe sp. PORK10 BA2]